MVAIPTPASPAVALFAAQNAGAYEGLMGRWSRLLAPQLVQFGGLADGDRVLDVGCGTGSLTFAVTPLANVAAVVGIDPSAAYVAFAEARNQDRRITFQAGDARALPFADNTFDRAYCQLVLQFIPEARRAVMEMCRTVRAGGTVTAAVWDTFGGFTVYRMLWDSAGVLDPDATAPRNQLRSLTAPGQMAAMWTDLGLRDVAQTDLLVRMNYASFDDYWQPIESGDGPVGHYVVGLSGSARATLREQVLRAYLASQPDGARSFASVALACRGTVPE